jgi:Holliday junction resolvase
MLLEASVANWLSSEGFEVLRDSALDDAGFDFLAGRQDEVWAIEVKARMRAVALPTPPSPA